MSSWGRRCAEEGEGHDGEVTFLGKEVFDLVVSCFDGLEVSSLVDVENKWK